MKRVLWAWVVAACGLASADAAVMRATYQQLSGSDWQVSVSVTNDGRPAEIAGFTVYFSHLRFADLALRASPVSWDSIVIQPDPALVSPGFLDSMLIGPDPPLTFGQSLGGFQVRFTLLGADPPPMLPFDIVDEDFDVLFSGITTTIPEPGTLGLMVAGLATVVGARRRAGRPVCAATGPGAI